MRDSDGPSKGIGGVKGGGGGGGAVAPSGTFTGAAISLANVFLLHQEGRPYIGYLDSRMGEKRSYVMFSNK